MTHLVGVPEVKVGADLSRQRLVVVVPDERHVARKSVNVAAEMESVVGLIVRCYTIGCFC